MRCGSDSGKKVEGELLVVTDGYGSVMCVCDCGEEIYVVERKTTQSA